MFGYLFMCFSAQASFIAAGFLYFIGLACLRKQQKKSELFIALIPGIFAMQQTAEGFVWLALQHQYTLGAVIAAYIFLLFAFFVWPVWIPYALYNLEYQSWRKRILSALYYGGLLLGTVLYGYALTMGISVQMQTSHIAYNVTMNDTTAWLATIAYLICTVGSALISSAPYVPLFGLLVGCAYGISYYTYYHHIISIWCFFAAIMSGCIYLIICAQNNRSHNTRNN